MEKRGREREGEREEITGWNIEEKRKVQKTKKHSSSFKVEEKTSNGEGKK